MTKALILSVKPRYAARILDGSKSTELRTRRVGAPEGTPLIVYATSPTMAIVGTARLQRTVWSAPDAAWVMADQSLGLDRHEFDRYVSNRRAVSLLFLESVSALERPIALKELRDGRPFQPPQGYRYVLPTDPWEVHALVSMTLEAVPAFERATPRQPVLTRDILSPAQG